MNKKEKEAIKVLKEMQQICKNKTYIENEERNEWYREYKAIDTILNLTDKLQQELKQQKMTYDKLFEHYNERVQEIIKLEKEIDYIKDFFVDKKKIRGKINELDLEFTSGDIKKADYYNKIEILRELLEEE